MKIKTSFVLIALALVAFSSFLFFGRKAAPRSEGPRKLKVVATLFPLYDMASSIGGAHAEVSLLLPPGVEPHSFEPKPGDMARIDRADVFIYTGEFMEPWARALIKGSSNKELLVVSAGSGIALSGTGASARPDPHIWLDLGNARVMARTIAEAFEKKDPGNGVPYRASAAAYDRELAALDEGFRKGLASCRTKEIIYGGHYAFGYMARRYGLTYSAAQGLSPDAEPTARDLAALVDRIKKDRIHAVFYEELTSPKIAETIAGETGAKMLMLNAAHNITKDQLLRGVTFFDILNNDLASLREGLECR